MQIECRSILVYKFLFHRFVYKNTILSWTLGKTFLRYKYNEAMMEIEHRKYNFKSFLNANITDEFKSILWKSIDNL